MTVGKVYAFQKTVESLRYLNFPAYTCAKGDGIAHTAKTLIVIHKTDIQLVGCFIVLKKNLLNIKGINYPRIHKER